jgi:uncharacterized DUF497 family protein
MAFPSYSLNGLNAYYVLTCVSTFVILGNKRHETVRFEWDDWKSKQNLAKHDVDFQTAELVFDDPYAVTIRDLFHSEEEDRYITLGEIGPGAVLFVVHTWFADRGEEVIRLISARAATSKERRSYEKAHKKPETPNRRHRREKRRRH